MDRAASAGKGLRADRAAALSLDPVVDPMLRDCDYGRWGGRRLTQVQSEQPDGVAAWLVDVDAAPHGGESIRTLLGRVAIWLDEHDRDGGHGVAVTHATVISAAILHAIGARGTGSSALVFNYTVASGQNMPHGPLIPATSASRLIP